ncbi:hypothetical protein [Capnocytophaga sp.]|uniref:hypothetical protein n=1 Tax=Capnocytophaga sp. TaxID=44737 RepID=UPI0026DAC4E7|nr:hypothetical protein [Capnocytophaga sp.]MDO5104472.1 hypothetical protein [Capnocytophaga sp.]
MLKPQENQKKVIRKRYLARLREAYANTLFSKFLNEYPGTLTMKFSKGAWRLSFSCGHEKVQAQGKTLAHALINLTAKSDCLTSKSVAL